MTIRLLDGSVLIRGGDIALHEDCCCTPPCYPDPCIIPSCSICNKCWDAGCGECRTLQSLEVSITGVGDSTICAPDALPGDCCYGFDGCKCDTFNSTFIHDFTTNTPCNSSFDLDTSNYPFTFDTCGTSQSLACGGLQIDKGVSIRVVFATKQYPLTAGGLKWSDLPCGREYGYVCQNYTIGPGHVVFVTLNSRISNFGLTAYEDTKIFVYDFLNSAKSDIDCPEDQRWAQCNWIGGTANLIISRRYSMFFGTPTYFADCESFDENCKLADAVVTVEPPSLAPCTEEEGP